MDQLTHNTPVPRAALIGAALLLALSFMLAGMSRTTGIGATSTANQQVIASHELRFQDRADGAVTVFRSDSDELVAELPPGTNGFVRGVMRGMARERRMNKVGSLEPFILNRMATGELRLEDPATGRVIDLQAFGPDNLGAFERIYAAADAAAELR